MQNSSWATRFSWRLSWTRAPPRGTFTCRLVRGGTRRTPIMRSMWVPNGCEDTRLTFSPFHTLPGCSLRLHQNTQDPVMAISSKNWRLLAVLEIAKLPGYIRYPGLGPGYFSALNVVIVACHNVLSKRKNALRHCGPNEGFAIAPRPKKAFGFMRVRMINFALVNFVRHSDRQSKLWTR